MGKARVSAAGVLDWLARIEFVWRVIVSGVLGTGLRAILSNVSRIPTEWLWPIAFLVTGIVLGIWEYLSKSRIRSLPKDSQQPQMKPVVSRELGTIEKEYRKYDHRMFVDLEEIVNELLKQFDDANDRATALLQLLGIMWASYEFNRKWMVIYRSQIEALEELNSAGPLARGELQAFYDRAIAQHPQAKEFYPFENWLGWMFNEFLIVDEVGKVRITVMGNEFLQYILRQGWSKKDRPF